MFAFNENFARLQNAGKTVEFKLEWRNGTGYLDNIVKDASIDEQSAFVDIGGRRGIVTPTPFGNVAVFERYVQSADDNRSNVFVCNVPDEIRKLFGSLFSGSLSEAAVFTIVDSYDGHLGDRLKEFLTVKVTIKV
jgi:hypothetical protein